MQYSLTLASVLALAGSAVAAPGQMTKRAQTVYLAGDSTMAKSPSPPIEGWGVYAQGFLSLPVVNKAIGGRSSRSYTDEGRFADIISVVQPNDIVVIEFGHNDGGGLNPGTVDNGRAVCTGSGDETCTSTYNGKQVTVHTFPWYLTQAGKAIIAKGAKVIISSQTPNNPWESGQFVYTDGGRFVTYAKAVAQALGSNAMYVDHGAYAASAWSTLGKTGTDDLFPIDHTHTNPAGAQLMAQAFFKGVQCGGGGFLKGFVKDGASIPGKCL
ncbi:hypothetical protein CFE70_009722 [Pyrenophora teres f. teres 0-1]|uniref:SGNH hydrolase-type esterase domain-containing protein n=2 Tax=Pyrenophora teres f. teres TaxID=97479 RepID=E3RVB8_PYRTT|nr:hypothetical protein PTT_13109 [Pyrenophora teres f. teres 0-1]KAE8827066.1 hypothetical protein HRS9139_08238 [Pyrenophora teres f. teres]KAE8832584.1 hypothetical protein PTNB85_06976 [Pyrenophora teres f. teres]KAE8836807.1 hypothetical protein HRS9122_06962 [Pyrenophora teres f. teres]KAE8856245.1 hypothetical protein PTNB29_09084 [Pyrenophora teres f. teres]